MTPNTPIKYTPLYPIAQRLNAQFTEHRRWHVPEVYTTLEAEIAAAQNGVVLADETPNGKLVVEGAQAEDALRAAFGLPSLKVNEGQPIGETDLSHIYRLRNDLFFISTPPGGETATRKTLTDTIGESEQFITVTDITHGRVEIRVIGPTSSQLLSKVCGLDFHPTEFPNHHAKQSSLAKTHQLIIRRDIGELPAFSIIGARSLGAYVWEILSEAGREFGLIPIGRAAVVALERTD
jgi:heterotetrameric sarcosine oxidase gamma subunit